MKEPKIKVTKKPKNGVTKIKRVNKNLKEIAFKRFGLLRLLGLNAISFRSVTRFWSLFRFWSPFWSPLKTLLINNLYTMVTKVTKIYSKTNLGKIYGRTLKAGNTRTHVYSPIYSFVGFLVTLVTVGCNPLFIRTLIGYQV